MNVRLAAQTISFDVAHSIKQLNREQVPGFQSEASCEFIRVGAMLFQIMNVERGRDQGSFKKPICVATKDEIFNFFAYVEQYLNKIQINDTVEENIVRRSVFKTKSNTPFFEF